MGIRPHAHGGRDYYYIQNEGFKSAVLHLKHRSGKKPMLAGAGHGPAYVDDIEAATPPDPERAFQFCRMFNLDKFEPDDEALIELGRAMTDPDSAPTGDTNIPAGMTYLGQFIDHDITRDLTAGFPTEALDPQDIENGRTPAFDLDNVYGFGPTHPKNTVPYEADGRISCSVARRDANFSASRDLSQMICRAIHRMRRVMPSRDRPASATPATTKTLPSPRRTWPF